MNTDQQYCFCELAPLYALGMLSEPERAWVEQQVHDCPELAEELAEYQDAVTVIPYSAPVETPSKHLKERLFDRLGLDTAFATAADPAEVSVQPSAPFVQEASSTVRAVTSQDLKWEPHPVPGVTTATLHIDPIKREIVGLLRADPATQYPLHRHADFEEIYMLTGDLTIGDKVYGPGDYIRSERGSAHAHYSADGCSFFFRTSLDDEFQIVLRVFCFCRYLFTYFA